MDLAHSWRQLVLMRSDSASNVVLVSLHYAQMLLFLSLFCGLWGSSPCLPGNAETLASEIGVEDETEAATTVATTITRMAIIEVATTTPAALPIQ